MTPVPVDMALPLSAHTWPPTEIFVQQWLQSLGYNGDLREQSQLHIRPYKMIDPRCSFHHVNYVVFLAVDLNFHWMRACHSLWLNDVMQVHNLILWWWFCT